MLAPRYIRYGNLVTDLGQVDSSPESLPKTQTFESINRAKRFIRLLRLPPRTAQTLHFKSPGERRRVLSNMVKTLRDNRDGEARISVRSRWS
jgi:hypothetical protein